MFDFGLVFVVKMVVLGALSGGLGVGVTPTPSFLPPPSSSRNGVGVQARAPTERVVYRGSEWSTLQGQTDEPRRWDGPVQGRLKVVRLAITAGPGPTRSSPVGGGLLGAVGGLPG